MVTTCRVVYGDAGSISPASIDRAAPGEIIRIEYDLTADVDCAGVGVTLSVVSWSINADDDDGLLTLSADTTSGLIASTLATVDADITQRCYMITADIVTSDQRRLLRSCSLPVLETRRVNA